jgi:hypothetical protein
MKQLEVKMNEKNDGQLKTIKVLLVVLIITTAATAALVGVVMTQWTPVAAYYRQMIADEAAYEAAYGDEEAVLDEEGVPVEEEDLIVTDEESYADEEGEDVILTDEEGNPIEEEDITIEDEDVTEDATSEGGVTE